MPTFFDLPAELRDEIYVFALHTGKMISPTLNVESCIQPPLTRVNRQLRLEALPVFYSVHQVLLVLNYGLLSGPKASGFDWMNRIGTCNLQLVPSVKLLAHGFSAEIEQSDGGRVLQLKDTWFGTSVPPITLQDEAEVCQQAQEALDYMASETDHKGKAKDAGFAPMLTKNLFLFFVHVMVAYSLGLDGKRGGATALEMLLEEEPMCEEEMGLAKKYKIV
jgi:hypothetical protein